MTPPTLTQTLERSSAYFAAEPAAVSLVAEFQADVTFPIEFAAIRRGVVRDGRVTAELVTVERTEAAAQAALEEGPRMSIEVYAVDAEDAIEAARVISRDEAPFLPLGRVESVELRQPVEHYGERRIFVVVGTAALR